MGVEVTSNVEGRASAAASQGSRGRGGEAAEGPGSFMAVFGAIEADTGPADTVGEAPQASDAGDANASDGAWAATGDPAASDVAVAADSFEASDAADVNEAQQPATVASAVVDPALLLAQAGALAALPPATPAVPATGVAADAGASATRTAGESLEVVGTGLASAAGADAAAVPGSADSVAQGLGQAARPHAAGKADAGLREDTARPRAQTPAEGAAPAVATPHGRGAASAHASSAPAAGTTQAQTLQQQQQQQAAQAAAARADAPTRSTLAAPDAQTLGAAVVATTELAPRRIEVRSQERFDDLRGVGAAGGGEAGASRHALSADAALPVTGAFGTPTSGLEDRMNAQVSWWLSQKTQNAELTMDAPDGRQVEVSIAMQGNEAQVAFRAEQASTRDLLGSALPQLREALGGDGVVLAGVTVDSFGARAQGEGGAQGEGARQGRPSGRQGLTVAEVQPARTGSPRVAGSSSVDLYV